MTNCDKCDKKIGLLDKKISYEDDKGGIVYYCADCDKKEKEYWKEKEEKTKKTEHNLKVKEALKKNNVWEYKIVNLSPASSGINATGNKIKETDEKILNELGSEGWELISAVPMDSLSPKFGVSCTATEWVSCIFKRKL